MPKKRTQPGTTITLDTGHLTIAEAAGSAHGSGRARGHGAAYTHLPDEHPLYSLVGRIASECAHVEHALDLIIWQLAEIKRPFGACITGQLIGATPRYYAIVALATERGLKKSIIKKVNELKNDSYGLWEERNRIIHDPWYIDIASQVPAQFRSMPRKKPIYGFSASSQTGIEEIIAGIEAIFIRVVNLQALIDGELSSLREKHS